MSKNRPYLVVIIAILLSTLCGGVYFFYLQQQQQQQQPAAKIIWGWNEGVGSLPFLIAYEQGFFKEEGLEVTPVKEDSYTTMLTDLKKGKIDFSGNISLIDVIGGGL